MSIHQEGKLREPVVRWLVNLGMVPVFESCGLCDVVGVKWTPQIGRLVPKIELLICVELKLDDVAGVIRQASSHRERSHQGWCAMPEDRIAMMRPATLDKFREAGVGLLACNGEASVVIEATNRPDFKPYESVRRNLWRRKNEWPTRLNRPRSDSHPTTKGPK